jgi:hypothetical protein
MQCVTLDFEDIAELYWHREMTVNEIANELGIPSGTLSDKLKKSDFPIRTRREYVQLMKRKGRLNSTWTGSQSITWKGGMYNDGHGYIMVLTENGYMRRSHLVWEQSRGRKLPDGWVVHHINGIKDDDRPENLAAYPPLKHVHLIPKLLSTISILKRENDALRNGQSLLIEHKEEELVGI